MPGETCDISGAAVPKLFISLRAGRKTGTAVFEYLQGQMSEKAVKKVYCKDGDVIFASSNLREDWFGRWLVRSGRITQQQCDASEEIVKKTGKKQGAVLVELGFINPPGLVEGVKLQVRDIILSLFNIRGGCFRFEEGPLPAADIIPLQMSIGNLVLQGLRQLDWQIARKTLPPPNTVLNLSSDPSVLFQKADLSADEAALLALIDGKRSIEELCALSGIGDFNTLRAVHVLLSLRMADSGAARTEDELRLAREALGRQAAAQAGTAAPSEAAASRADILKAFEEMPYLNHYQVLGIQKHSGEHEIKKAYFLLAKRYHPDRHFEPEMQDMKEKLETLFNRLHEAYEVLSNPERRQEYDPAKPQPAAPGFEERRPDEYVENYTERAAKAVAFYNAGMKDFKVGNFWGAAEAFSSASRLNPVKASYFYYYGLSLSHVPRRRHEAEENLQKAIEIDPLKDEYYLELGNLYLKSGLKQRALEVFREALLENPLSEKIREAIKAAGGSPDDKAGETKGGVFKKVFGKE
jgi:curved DNA-binding protein CbpA